jgi:predicted nucleotidyltransferase
MLQRAIARCFSKRREIAAAYIFGSVATGRTRPDSDVDIAVLLSQPLPASRALSYRLKLMAEVGAALHRADVDLVLLNDAPPLLAHRVLSKGRLVFERSRSARVRFQVLTAGRYADVVPMYETQIRYLKRQAQSGGRRG